MVAEWDRLGDSHAYQFATHCMPIMIPVCCQRAVDIIVVSIAHSVIRILHKQA